MSAMVLVSDAAISSSCAKARSVFPFADWTSASAVRLRGSLRLHLRRAAEIRLGPRRVAELQCRLRREVERLGVDVRAFRPAAGAFPGPFAPRPMRIWIWASRRRAVVALGRPMQRLGREALGLGQRTGLEFGGAGQEKDVEVVGRGGEQRLQQLPGGLVVLVQEREAGLEVARLRMIGKNFLHLFDFDFGCRQIPPREQDFEDARLRRHPVRSRSQRLALHCSAASASPLTTKSRSPLS